MKILLKSFIKLMLFFNIMFIISCGLPDVTSIIQEMNQPFITKLIPGPNKITVEFEAQNNEPAFSGYNIYFGDSVNPQKYRLYNSQKNQPTISAGTSQTINSYSFTIQSGGYYSEGSGEVSTLTESQLQNGIPIYVWVSAYQITPQAESYYSYNNYVQMATPRAESLNQTVNSGGNITLNSRQLASVSASGTGLSFQNSTGGIQSRSATSLTDITIPPTDGYTTSALTVEAQRLYLTKTTDGSGDSYYGKIFVSSVSGTSATVDYCLQQAANILSY